jgi:protease PrsW
MLDDPKIPNLQGSNLAPTIVVQRSRRPGVLKVVLAITLALIALLLGLLVLLLISVETGPIALLIGMIFASLPVPIYVMLVLWIDRYESEPLWMLGVAFFWGALIAVFIAFVLNTASGAIVTAVAQSERAGDTFGAVISAPIVEEGAKALILFVLFFWKKDEFDGVVDGIVYASMAGLGFAMTENIQYYGKAVLEAGGSGLTVIFIIRGALAPFSHPLFTSMTGIGLGLARQSTNQLVKFATPVLGLLTAIFMHSIWNGSVAIFGGLGFLLSYFLIMVPAFLLMLVLIFLSLRSEGRIVSEFLLPDFQRGVLTPQEYNQLCNVGARMGASFGAFSRGGMASWRACMQFNQVASELAFHRSRVARGIFTNQQAASEREAAYLQMLQELRQRLRTN